DPQTIADTVSTPLEQQINGVEDILYMSSYSSADGAKSLEFFGKTGKGDGNAVLDKHLKLVEIGAELEGDRQRHGAV
ncbi:hypothetical protein ACC796_36995, partial [Rhizobium ruizarguesonis]